MIVLSKYPFYLFSKATSKMVNTILLVCHQNLDSIIDNILFLGQGIPQRNNLADLIDLSQSICLTYSDSYTCMQIRGITRSLLVAFYFFPLHVK